jgi:methyltransferase (TIGR00027 family)
VGGTHGGQPAGVGRTALGVAMIRAAESQRPDRLFDDPYAAAFLAAAPGALEASTRAAAAARAAGAMPRWAVTMLTNVVVRTRFYDDYLTAATGQGIDQVVLLGAGLDSRAYRLTWPAGVRLFEVDLPDVLDFKHRVLADAAAVAGCERHPVAADLREDWSRPLLESGFRPAEPTCWLIEGLLIYLSAEQAAALLGVVGGLSAPGSRVAFEFEDLGTDPVREQARRSAAMTEYAAMWQGGLPDPAGWLATHGWRSQQHDRAEVGAGYGRAGAGPSQGGFVTAERDASPP